MHYTPAALSKVPVVGGARSEQSCSSGAGLKKFMTMNDKTGNSIKGCLNSQQLVN